MMDERSLCIQHGVHTTILETHDKEIVELKKTVRVMEGTMQDMKVQQIKDGEKIITLFNIVSDIKTYVQEINEKIDNKQDTFKDFVFKIGIEVVKAGIIGGLLYQGFKGMIG